MSKSKTNPVSTLMQLEEEDFNNLFQKYKVLILALIVLIIAAVIGKGIYSKNHMKKMNIMAEDIHLFKVNVLDPWVAAKEKPTSDWMSVKSKYGEVISKHGHQSTFTPVVIELIKELIKKDKKAEALTVAKPFFESTEDVPLVNYIIGSYVAGLSEDLGENDFAIEVNEKLLKAPQKFLEAKTYLDLGRLYKKAGNTDKAKVNLEYVINNFSTDEIVPLAKVYLSELKPEIKPEIKPEPKK